MPSPKVRIEMKTESSGRRKDQMAQLGPRTRESCLDQKPERRVVQNFSTLAEPMESFSEGGVRI